MRLAAPTDPCGPDLWEAWRLDVNVGSLAEELHRALHAFRGIDHVVSGKLLAVKHSKSLPILDTEAK